MNVRMIAAIGLIVLGLVALSYGRISFTRQKTVADIGPLQLKQEKRETIPLSPLLGVLALASGVVLIAWRRPA